MASEDGRFVLTYNGEIFNYRELRREFAAAGGRLRSDSDTEILLRLLGRERGTAGTVEGGLEVLRGFLTQAGIPNDQYLFYDGSGLSRQNLVTPHAIAQLLRQVGALLGQAGI